MTKIDTSSLVKLRVLNISHTNIFYLDCTPLVSLIELIASVSELAEIKTSSLGKLEELDISMTQISRLDGSPLVSLVRLIAYCR